MFLTRKTPMAQRFHDAQIRSTLAPQYKRQKTFLMNQSLTQALSRPDTFWSTAFNAEEPTVSLNIGHMKLAIRREIHEWQLFYQWQKNEIAKEADDFDDTVFANKPNERMVLSELIPTIRMTPRLPDRPVVVRPFSPLTITANTKVTLYVTTPIWLGLELSGHLCKELPVQPLSDTWMGDLTGKGELCYGSKTHARLNKNLLSKVPHRVLTPIVLHNKSTTDSKLERLSIPMPYLSVFLIDNQLTTETLKFTMDPDNGQGIVKIHPSEAQHPRLFEARKTAEKGVLINAWSNLFA